MATAKEVLTHPSFLTVLTILVLVNFILIMVYVIGGMQSDLRSRSFPAIRYEANIIHVTAASRELESSESGSLVVVDNYAGCSITLPPVKWGDIFNFQIRATGGAGVYINTKTAGSANFDGAITVLDTENNVVDRGAQSFVADSGDDRIVFNGTTTGGLDGTQIRLVGISGVSWLVEGSAPGTSAAGVLDYTIHYPVILY